MNCPECQRLWKENEKLRRERDERDKEIAKLRETLEQIAQPHEYNEYSYPEELLETMDEDIEIAREALK